MVAAHFTIEELTKLARLEETMYSMSLMVSWSTADAPNAPPVHLACLLKVPVLEPTLRVFDDRIAKVINV